MSLVETIEQRFGEVARDYALDLVKANNLSFVELMRKIAGRICAQIGTVTSDDLRRVARKYGIEPNHPNAWGAIFRDKQWRIVGRRKSNIASNHAREIKVWSFCSGS